MSRTFRRQALQKVPDITPPSPTAKDMSFYGDNIDRILNGQITRELLIEAEKAKKKIETKEVEPIPQWPEKEQLIAILYSNHCVCGSSFPSFGFLARRSEDNSLSIAKPDPGEQPKAVETLPNEVPYCPICIHRRLANG